MQCATDRLSEGDELRESNLVRAARSRTLSALTQCVCTLSVVPMCVCVCVCAGKIQNRRSDFKSTRALIPRGENRNPSPLSIAQLTARALCRQGRSECPRVIGNDVAQRQDPAQEARASKREPSNPPFQSFILGTGLSHSGYCGKLCVCECVSARACKVLHDANSPWKASKALCLTETAEPPEYVCEG